MRIFFSVRRSVEKSGLYSGYKNPGFHKFPCGASLGHMYAFSFLPNLILTAFYFKFICLELCVVFNTVQGHITVGSFVGRGNQYIPTFPDKVGNHQLQKWEASVLLLCHCSP